MDITLQAGQRRPLRCKSSPRRRKSIEIRDLGDGAQSSVCKNREERGAISVCHRCSCRHFNFLSNMDAPRVKLPLMRFSNQQTVNKRFCGGVFKPIFMVCTGKVTKTVAGTECRRGVRGHWRTSQLGGILLSSLRWYLPHSCTIISNFSHDWCSRPLWQNNKVHSSIRACIGSNMAYFCVGVMPGVMYGPSF